MKSFSELPPAIRDAALRGLSDPEDSGAPFTAEEVVSDFTSGLVAKQLADLGSLANKAPLVSKDISPRAATAPDANEHSKLGDYPNDSTYIR